MFTLVDFRQENHILVITISTISMCQNWSMSVSADPGGAPQKSAHLAHPRYNYDMQSSDSDARTAALHGHVPPEPVHGAHAGEQSFQLYPNPPSPWQFIQQLLK